MILQSCQNCWFNGLQYGPLGLPVGYCSRHLKILNVAENTTCGLQLRKDLSLQRAKQVSKLHRPHYSSDNIVRLQDREIANGEVSAKEADLQSLRSDTIGEIVSDYGLLGSKIESLAMLNSTSGARAEVAMLSLSIGYVSNCVERNGHWTSGLHLYWWTKSRLALEPDIAPSDIRTVDGIQLSRQVMLTAWSIIMLRLTLIDDIAEHAASEQDGFGAARGLLTRAAEDVQTFNIKTLTKWIRSTAIPDLERALPYKRYVKLANELHVDHADRDNRTGAYG